MSSIELVVARYTEPLNWLKRVPISVTHTILDKNAEAPWPGSVSLPNIGREAHSYLRFIVERYDSLRDVTVFCQGHPFDHVFDFHPVLKGIVDNPASVGEFLWMGHIIDTDDACGHRLFRGWSKNDDHHELDMNGFHRALFGSDGPSQYTFHLGAQFAVSRAQVQSRSREFWTRALLVAGEFPDAAHCFERSWDRVFGVVGIDQTWLNGRQTVYLKPIRRLQED